MEEERTRDRRRRSRQSVSECVRLTETDSDGQTDVKGTARQLQRAPKTEATGMEVERYIDREREGAS